MELNIQAQIWEENDKIADQMAKNWKNQGTFVFNLLGSPGAGKTTFLETTLELLKGKYRIGVIEGDLFTAQDAQRIEAKGIPAVQVNTSGGCHLDAGMVQEALEKFECPEFDLLIIENVGNLVCPAEFFLGEDAKVTLLSVAEGEDKPLKYPLIFKESAFIGITKSDLLPYLTYDLPKVKKDLKDLNPQGMIQKISSQTQEGIPEWIQWLTDRIDRKKSERV